MCLSKVLVASSGDTGKSRGKSVCPNGWHSELLGTATRCGCRAVGIHIYKSESCIPMLMETEADKHNFVEMVKAFGIPPPKSKKPEASGPAS